MELFLFRPSEYERLYNCSGIDVQSVPIERRQFVAESIVTLLLSTAYFVLYIPCLGSIWKRMRDGNHCYTMLFYIGLVDMAVLALIGFLQPWMSWNGVFYCTHPTLVYLSGSAAICLWICESSADLLLAVNRCMEIAFPGAVRILFDGWKTAAWLWLCTLYALYWLLFEPPLAFSATSFAWFFNPFEGYREDTQGQFSVRLHTIHDSFVAIGSPLIYLLFALAVWHKSRGLRTTADRFRVSKAQKSTFVQVLLISLINTVCCSFYMLMQYVEVRQWMVTTAQFSWLQIHGLPPVIYLALNPSIRRDVRDFFSKTFPFPNAASFLATNNAVAPAVGTL